MTERFYQLVLLKIRDTQTFGRFVTEASPAAARYESAERFLAPSHVQGAVDLPDLANVVYYESEQAFHDWHRDPDILAALPLRAASTDLLWLAGPSIGGRAPGAAGDASARRYLVEIARFGPGGVEAYQAYEQEVASALGPYGYQVERLIAPQARSAGWPFRADRVTVASFPDEAAMTRAQADPAHAALEGERYQAVVAESVWLVASTVAGLPDA